MKCLEVSGAVRPIHGPLGVKRLRILRIWKHIQIDCLMEKVKHEE